MVFSKLISKRTLLLFAGDLFLISLSFVLSRGIRSGAFHPDFLLSFGIIPGGSITLLSYVSAFYLADLYDLRLKVNSPGYLVRFLTAGAIASVTVAAVFYFIPYLITGRGTYLIYAGLVLPLTYGWRWLLECYFMKLLERPQNLLIVGAGAAGKALYEAIKYNPGFNVVGFIDDGAQKSDSADLPKIIGSGSSMPEALKAHKVESLIVAMTHHKNPDMIRNLLNSKLVGIEVHDMPSFYEEATGKLPVEHVDDLWFVNAPLLGVRKSVYNRKFKRVFDVVLSSVGLAVGSPVLFLAALAIKIESPGPVFFRQRRAGFNGEPFNLIKFRTMRVGTEEDRRFAGQKDDPRITRVGRALRRARIDEMPQMWNVLKGEMSFIGPRALMEEEVESFKSRVPYFSVRHTIRPGITGWAQVNYRHGASLDDAFEKLKYDLFYIKNLSFFLDMTIFLKTVRVVMFGRGAR